MHLLPPANECRRPLTDDPDFWLRDLRLGRYAELARNLADGGYRAARIAALLPTKRALACVADCLGLPADGTMAALRQRLLDTGAPVAPYLLAADFSRRTHKLAVEEIARAVLAPEAWAATLDERGEPDRLLLHLRLLQAAPEALVHVRGLDTWYRHGADAFVLEQRVPMPEGRLGDFLTAVNVEAAVAEVPRPTGVPPIRFEMAVTRPNGDVLLCLRRNLKRAHLGSDDGAQIAHGHDEELILLHFLDGGRRLRLVQMEIREAPLSGQPELVFRATSKNPDLRPAIAHFEAATGPILNEPCRIRSVTLAFGSREVAIEFPPEHGEPLVRFTDGRLPRHDAQAFRALVAAHFGLGEHPVARSAG